MTNNTHSNPLEPAMSDQGTPNKGEPSPDNTREVKRFLRLIMLATAGRYAFYLFAAIGAVFAVRLVLGHGLPWFAVLNLAAMAGCGLLRDYASDRLIELDECLQRDRAVESGDERDENDD